MATIALPGSLKKGVKIIMKLKLGKMTSREIAEWFNIGYNRYSHNIAKYLDQLGYYCDFEKVYGGVIISQIYCDTFSKNFSHDIHLDIVAYIIDQVESGITTIYQMSSALGYSKYAIRKACNFCFGEGLKSSGPLGSKKKVWALRTYDGPQYPESEAAYMKLVKYRELTDDEKFRLSQLANKYYNALDDLANVFDAEDGDVNWQEVLQQKKKMYHAEVTGALGQELGGVIVRAYQYRIGDRVYIYENEEQYSEMLKEELRQKGYKIPEDWGKPPKSAK